MTPPLTFKSYSISRRSFHVLIFKLFALVFQFSSIIILTFYLGELSYAQFALLTLYVSWSIPLATLNLQVFASRKIPLSDKSVRNSLISNLLISAALPVTILSLLLSFLLFAISPISHLFLFALPLVSFISYNNILDSIFVASSLPVIAAQSSFVRFLWAPVFFFLAFFNSAIITLKFGVLLWILSEFVSILFLIFHLFTSLRYRPCFHRYFLYLKRSLRVGIYSTIFSFLIISTITIPRTFLGKFHTLDNLAEFQYLYVVASVIPLFIESSLFSVKSADIVKFAASRPSIRQYLSFHVLNYSSPTLLVFFYLLLLCLIFPFLTTAFPSYFSLTSYSSFLTLCLYFALFFVARSFHYFLYFAGFDRIILISSLSTSLISLISSVILIPRFNLLGVSLSYFTPCLFYLLIAFMLYSNVSKYFPDTIISQID